jgi:pilus assembly protein Flp/PilA
MNDLRVVAGPGGGCVAQPLRYGGSVTRRRAALSSNNCGDAAYRTAYGRCHSSGEELMSMLINYVKSFTNQEEGQDLLEYALLVALIALIAIGAVGLAGTAVNTIFTNIATALQNAA